MAATANTEVERNGLGALAFPSQLPQPHEATKILESEMNEDYQPSTGYSSIANPVLQSRDLPPKFGPAESLPISDVLGQLDFALGELWESAMMLGGRLAPVRRRVDDAGVSAAVSPKPGTSAYAVTLNGFYDRIRETKNFLNMVRDELEI